MSRTAERFSGVNVVRRNRAGGFCVAANAGIAAATGAIVELLNDDAEVTVGWAEAALRCFADTRVAAVAPLVLQNDAARAKRELPPRIDSAGDEYDPGGFARKRHNGAIWVETGGTAGTVFGASACAAFYRREALLRACGFPEHFGAYFEDVDLSFRLRRLGFEILHEPRSIVWHCVSGSYGCKPSRRTLERQSCNEERVWWRNVRGVERLRRFPRHAAVLAGKSLRRWQEGTLLPWLMGRLRAAAG